MKRLIPVALLCLPISAHAQQAPSAVLPPVLHGCGTIALTTASTAVTAANTTLCSGSTWPTSSLNLALVVNNQGSSAGAIYFCPTGGTCTTTGQYVAAGQGFTWNIPFTANAPTLTAVSTATVFIWW